MFDYAIALEADHILGTADTEYNAESEMQRNLEFMNLWKQSWSNLKSSQADLPS